jgi:hypothetical protein
MDTPAYFDEVIDVPKGKSDQEIIALAKARAEKVRDYDAFEPSWECDGLRIVAIMKIKEDKTIAEDIPIDQSPYDLGLVAKGALKGAVPLSEIMREGERQGITVQPAVEQAIRFADAALSKAQEIPEFEPFNLVLSAFECSEEGDGGPPFAVVNMTSDLLREIVR